MPVIPEPAAPVMPEPAMEAAPAAEAIPAPEPAAMPEMPAKPVIPTMPEAAVQETVPVTATPDINVSTAAQDIANVEGTMSEEMEMPVMEEDTFSFDEAPTDETGMICEGMTINGDVEATGSLDIIGTVNGNIKIRGKLNVSGSISGTSRASEIFADSAKITGDVISTGPVKVGQETVIIGNINATSAVIAGAVKGDIDVQGPVILDSSAIVMGDIKSKAVQINNGAVIEGHCSQCYADVSPTSFFSNFKGKE
ncbi:MAG: polymer-forming cytoskeletal protein [Lachnospiraceae bacterium]|nr:polymer-forming cytoskeletal protein [Lachnospiraceae bacterium]